MRALMGLSLAFVMALGAPVAGLAGVGDECDPAVAKELQSIGDANAEMRRDWIESSIKDLEIRELSCLDDLFGFRGTLIFSVPTLDDILNALKTMVCNAAEEVFGKLTTGVYESISIPGLTLPGEAYIPGAYVSFGASTGAGVGGTGGSARYSSGRGSASFGGSVGLGVGEDALRLPAEADAPGVSEKVRRFWDNLWGDGDGGD